MLKMTVQSLLQLMLDSVLLVVAGLVIADASRLDWINPTQNHPNQIVVTMADGPVEKLMDDVVVFETVDAQATYTTKQLNINH